MKRRSTTAVALTVAGSDSGGGAGIQADLKTFHAHGVFGTSAITCITAQNPSRVSAVQPLNPRLVAEQMDRIFEAFPVGGAKTGMLYDAAIIEAVAKGFARRKFGKLVVDPVMVASSGALLLKKNAVTALTSKLFPHAAVVTPNLAEAEVLARRTIRTLDDLRLAARVARGEIRRPVSGQRRTSARGEPRRGRLIRWQTLLRIPRGDGAEDQDPRHGMHVLGGDRRQPGAGSRFDRVHRACETICDDGHS